MKKSGHFKLGLFIISAFTILVLGLISLGMLEIFQKSQYMETYLEESVQGLDVGSPVKYRGVKIGSVHTIDFVRNEYDLKDKGDAKRFDRFLILKMNLPDGFGMVDKSNFDTSLNKLIQQGLRVRLASQGLTGQAYLEIDFLETDRFTILNVPWEPKTPYLPSAPSKIAQISSAVESFVDKVDKAGVADIAKNMDNLMVVSANAIEGAKLPGVSRDFSLMLNEIRQTNLYLQKVVKDPALQQTPKELETTLVNLNRTAKRLDFILASNQDGINETVENFRIASRDLKEITQNAKRYPSHIFFGNPPGKATGAK